MQGEEKEKRIIVDEDWKRRVEEEKKELAEEARQKRDPTQPPPQAGAMPPASFEMLLTTLATEAMIALGQVPHPATGKAEVQPEQAKYFIDTLSMLQQKTQGNLTSKEQQALEGLLHQLRMAYLIAQGGPPTAEIETP